MPTLEKILSDFFSNFTRVGSCQEVFSEGVGVGDNPSMRILELALQAFGPFTDVTLDLSGGSEGLHLVHGPNEAGKSSALRGLRQALFGFPVQSPDDFLHPYKKFRVGMRLRDDEGRELAFVRRKGSRETLLAEDGSTPLPDDTLDRLLGAMTEAEFGRRFALDHDELVAGGKSILDGAGELGQLLFQAGGGLRDLLEVRRDLDRELEALFKPAGAKPRINAGLAELKEARAAVRGVSLPSSEWVEHDAAHRRAVEQLEAVEARLASAPRRTPSPGADRRRPAGPGPAPTVPAGVGGPWIGRPAPRGLRRASPSRRQPARIRTPRRGGLVAGDRRG